MKLKGIYAEKSAFTQLTVLLLFILAGALFSSLAGTGLVYLIHGSDLPIMEDPNAMRLYQLVTATGTFLLPALATGWLCSHSLADYLFLKLPSDPKVWILTLASMFFFSPFTTLTGLWNKEIRLPHFMAPVEKWIQEQELLAEQPTEVLLNDISLVGLFSNIVVIAVLAAITEEFLFRGTLQRILGKWFKNYQTVIWITAIIFSAFHLQFYGFIPRLLLGAYFGYLFFWGKSIWLPVFAHFTNNTFAVIAISNSTLKENEYINGEIPADGIFVYTLWAGAMLILFFLCVKKLRAYLGAATN